ncbi:MAG TPA: polysaccharide biosynthesis/export family protein, partial [Armatimonadota bacterium]|nr:polysaccharide biosynthesis/export family protein [Armatimonadota bacterium]
MRRARWLLSLVVMLLLAAPPVLAQAPPPQPPDKDYIIGPEDILEIQVWGNKDLNQVVFVRPDGRTSLPLVGEIGVAGKTVQQLQDHLTNVYEKTV